MGIRRFVKEHKKEVLSAAVGAGVASYIFVKFGKRSLPKSSNVSLHISTGMSDEDFFNSKIGTVNTGYFKLYPKDMELKDLGKVGEQLIEAFPCFKETTSINDVSTNYRLSIK